MQAFQEINALFKVESLVPTTAQSGKKILIIDDNRDIQNSLVEILKSDYELISCYTWSDVEKNFSPDIDLALLDIKMPDFDGITIFSRLKEKMPNCKIIFNSAYPGDDIEAKKIERLAHNGYLTKGNYNIVELREYIKKAMES
ncbi:MAG: response regulator [Leptospiraceae bacterium]|nr:response regulator [Leptospiraceae bacterium]